MDLTTLIFVVAVILLLGGGWYLPAIISAVAGSTNRKVSRATTRPIMPGAAADGSPSAPTGANR